MAIQVGKTYNAKATITPTPPAFVSQDIDRVKAEILNVRETYARYTGHYDDPGDPPRPGGKDPRLDGKPFSSTTYDKWWMRFNPVNNILEIPYTGTIAAVLDGGQLDTANPEKTFNIASQTQLSINAWDAHATNLVGQALVFPMRVWALAFTQTQFQATPGTDGSYEIQGAIWVVQDLGLHQVTNATLVEYNYRPAIMDAELIAKPYTGMVRRFLVSRPEFSRSYGPGVRCR